MDFDSDDEDFNFSDDKHSEDGDKSKNLEETFEKSPAKKVTGVKHLLELKQTLQLDSFSAKKKSKQAKKKRQKEIKWLQKQQQTGFISFDHSYICQNKLIKLIMQDSNFAHPGSAMIQTLAKQLSGKVFTAPEVVVFIDPRKKQKDGKGKKSAVNQLLVQNLVDRKKAQEEANLSMKQAQ